MGISNYLHDKATEAIIRDSEKESIIKSIVTIKERLDEYFDDVEKHFIFGSYTRNTILPRNIDKRSDIDYMVVFQDNDCTPQTYLNKLRGFVEKYYAKSEIKQSHPTIKLDLNHITFELVPALNTGWFGDNYQIPSKDDDIDDWIDTDPNNFNEELTEANIANKDLIKPLIRLLKYWNAKYGYIFESFLFEKDIVATDYFWIASNKSLKDYLYKYIESMEVDESIAQWKQDQINKLKETVEEAKSEESKDNYEEAKNIIRKIFKDEDCKKSLALRHVEKPKWEMQNHCNVAINATRNGHRFNSNDLLNKDLNLVFNAKTNATKPFDVYWQVVNTGQEAKNADCLRGDIFISKTAGSGGLIRKENTEYTGSHWIECFIVKNNICLAKSGKFIVRIK